MEKGTQRYWHLFLLLAVIWLGGCEEPDASKQIVLDDANEYESILIGEYFGTLKENEKKFIRDEKLVHDFAKEMHGKELIQPTDAQRQEKRRTLTEPDSYHIGLFKAHKFTKEYGDTIFFTFYPDGTIEVEQLGNVYFVKNPHPKLINEFKTAWDIRF